MAGAEGGLPKSSYIVLRAADGSGWPGAVSGAAQRSAELRIVLLHGWLQSLDAWLLLAQRLRDVHRADVLLVDYYAHGHSAPLPDARMHTPYAYVQQVRRVVEHLGWHTGGVVLGGASLGASVAMHYAARYEKTVLGLLLMAPSGLPDPWNPVPRAASCLSRCLLGEDLEAAPQVGREASASRDTCWQRALAKLNVVKSTPCYGHSEATLSMLRERGWPITVLVGRYDICHTPQVATWRALAPQAHIVVTARSHTGICSFLGDFALEADPLWAEAKARAAMHAEHHPRRGPPCSKPGTTSESLDEDAGARSFWVGPGA